MEKKYIKFYPKLLIYLLYLELFLIISEKMILFFNVQSKIHKDHKVIKIEEKCIF